MVSFFVSSTDPRRKAWTQDTSARDHLSRRGWPAAVVDTAVVSSALLTNADFLRKLGGLGDEQEYDRLFLIMIEGVRCTRES